MKDGASLTIIEPDRYPGRATFELELWTPGDIRLKVWAENDAGDGSPAHLAIDDIPTLIDWLCAQIGAGPDELDDEVSYLIGRRMRGDMLAHVHSLPTEEAKRYWKVPDANHSRMLARSAVAALRDMPEHLRGPALEAGEPGRRCQHGYTAEDDICDCDFAALAAADG